MDSITHIVMGAAIGDRLLGKKIGRKAAWMGALAKTFPDFDLFYSGLNDPRKYILYHRSYTHSFIIETLMAIPLSYIMYLLFRKKITYKSSLLFWLVCMWAHSLVDVCTNYGTRIFLPFTQKLYSLNNIAIADIFLTLPILLLVTIALFYKNSSKGRSRLMNISLIYSVLYFVFTFINKSAADKVFNASIKENNIEVKNYMSNPTILNSWLWYGVVQNDSNLYIAEFTLLSKNQKPIWKKYAVNKALLKESKSKDARMLEWFSQGFYFTQKNEDTLEVFIPKFGRGNLDETDAKKTFLFYYKIYKKGDEWIMDAQQPNSKEMNFKDAFVQLYRKIIGK